MLNGDDDSSKQGRQNHDNESDGDDASGEAAMKYAHKLLKYL